MDVVAPISAPMLQIVAIPREVGEEITGSNEKAQGHPIVQKWVYAKNGKAMRDQAISHRNLKPQLRGHWQHNGRVSPLHFWSIQSLQPDSCGRNEPKVTLTSADTSITRNHCNECPVPPYYLIYLYWRSQTLLRNLMDWIRCFQWHFKNPIYLLTALGSTTPSKGTAMKL